MTSLVHDVRYAVRLLARRPGFAVAALGTLAVAIAANTAIFTLVRGVLLRPLALPQPDRVVRIEEQHQGARLNLTGATFNDLADRSRSLAAVAAYRISSPGFSTGSLPEQVVAAEVSPAYFDVLGVGPALGRGFRDDDFAEGARRTLVLSDGVWRRLFGGSAEAIGRTVLLGAVPADVVGVMPAGIYAPGSPAVWIPRTPLNALPRNRRAHLFTVLGRVGPGFTLDDVRTELATLAAQIDADSGGVDRSIGLAATPLQERLVESVRPALLILWAAVGVVLLIGAANIANLLLMQGSARARELAIRRALGAGPGRLARQLVIESAVLGVSGGAIGTVLGIWLIGALAPAFPATLPRVNELSVDGLVVLFGVGLSIAAALLFGGVSAWRGAAGGSSALRDRSAAPRSASLRVVLVTAEVALTVVLLAGAGLLARSFTSVLRIDPGFDPSGIVTFDLSLPAARYPDARAHSAFYADVLGRVGSIPGVASAAVTGALPLTGTPATTMVPEGRSEADGLEADVVPISAEFFATMRIPLRAGRSFSAADRAGAAPVVIVNEAAAAQFWPGASHPLGRRLVMRDWGEPYEAEVVGVVGDVRQIGLEMRARPAAYYPIAQFPQTLLRQSIVLRAAGDERRIVAAAREQVWAVDRDQAIASVRRLDEVLDTAVAQRRFNAALIAAFALTALLLSGLGVYGVVAFALAQRAQEIGIRVALGATPADIVALAARAGVLPVAAGCAVGLAGALASSRALESLLFGVTATDATTLGGAAAIVVLLGVASCIAPTRRALRVDPASALRQ